MANAKLELLWSVVVEHHAQTDTRNDWYIPSRTDSPICAGKDLEIAETIRRHAYEIKVGIDTESTHTPAGYASTLHYLNQRYGHLILFVPAVAEDYAEGQ